MGLTVQRHDLPLRAVATARGAIAHRTVWVVTIACDGIAGRGEAAPLPGFGGETPEACAAVLQRLTAVEDREWAAWEGRGPLPGETLLVATPCARFAVEAALLERMARRADMPVAAWLGGSATRLPVNALVDDADGARRARDEGFPVIKAKIGGDPAVAHARAHALAAVGVPLRLDANGTWHAEAVVAAGLPPLELLEQPLPGIAGHGELRVPGRPIGLDEAIRTPADVRSAVGQADVIVLKPQFLGGWAAFSALAGLARRLGFDVVATTALEGAIGRATALHYAAAAGLTSRAQGLATGDRLAADLVPEPLVPTAGFMAIPAREGWGV